ncbi:MAG: bifunctional proline dehydrogenase/L-glutamate gamma-semialdehyde dehydrogenase PutA [Candidatus Accumulibacter sp.]|nr:bifunctional proline dehydrogenase/L-glutamate gamma-semialdehyde dehydrogenase PutA [Accumulibacter sp.]
MNRIEGGALRRALRETYRADETRIVDGLIEKARFTPEERRRVFERAKPLVETIREKRLKTTGIDAFLNTYDLSSREGVVLMCLAEALLRIPDTETVDRLIRDKIGNTEWAERLGASHSTFVNAGTWALMLTGRIVHLDDAEKNLGGVLKRLITRVGEPVIRQAIVTAMRILGKQFVMGRGIGEALERAAAAEAHGYRHTFDMLGEAARTAADALRYEDLYGLAIDAIGAAGGGRPALEAPSVSIKLSALHPRYEVANEEGVRRELWPVVRKLALKASKHGIGFTIDAEEMDRLELSLDLIEFLALDPELAGWDGLGMAVQAYQKRAYAVVEWLAELAHRSRRRFGLRLVKGAYWDAEIKAAQERGLAGYPVFTRKVNTDVSYLACAKRMFADPAAFYPAFATHNAHTLAAVAEIAGDSGEWEYQRLHGMGEELYGEVVGPDKWGRACRVYAPVGSHEELLAYLVRRLLENGANSSFVNRIADERMPVEQLVADPVEKAAALAVKPHPGIPLPRQLFGAARANSEGLDMNDKATLDALRQAIERSVAEPCEAAPLIGGKALKGRSSKLCAPADRRDVVGSVIEAGSEHAAEAMRRAAEAFPGWSDTRAGERAAILERAADTLQQRLPELSALIVREGGRTQGDAVSEVREAIDFCRYYAAQAREKFAAPIALPGPTGERNTLSLHGRGVFVCISPWNFPLAIFVGQIAAALAAGNAVVAKPSGQTPLVASQAVRILHAAGVPGDVLAFLPGGGGRIGAALVADPRCAGVAFTGSTEVARTIARTLAAKPGPIVPLIAETGGQNAMIVDSSALAEQVVRDAVTSAFNSAGQRCSALRVLFLQEDIADKVSAMLRGAMQTLRVGNPVDIRTDVGPVIDDDACYQLKRHVRKLEGFATPIQVCQVDEELSAHGSFFAPCAYEIDDISRLEHEVFGPILHVVRWRSDQLDEVCDAIARTGYGLTLGIHSRIDETVERVTRRLRVGNTYVNRNIIGAAVGVQPFGGEGLSGTGPKAGGPHYLYRFACERTLSVDTTASGGNAILMSLDKGEE